MSTASSAAVGPPPGMPVRLSSNESPFGPSPAAMEAAQLALAEGHRYPDDQSVDLRTAVAAHEGVAFEQVAVGTGSAALLMDIIPHVCADVDDAEVVAFSRSFVVYRLAARNAGARYVEVPTEGPATVESDGYGRDVDVLLDHVSEATRVVAIDNPGNPTGAHLTGEQLERLLSALPEQVTVVIDEAYHHFATGQRGYQRVAELSVDHPRLLVLTTFSKAFALAGLRVGAVTGPADLIGPIDGRRTRFNVSVTGQAAAIASLEDAAHLRHTVEGTLEGRARMAAGLQELGVPFTDGLGNFLTVELGAPSPPYVEAYADHGVGVRPLAPYGMDEQLRISVGTPSEVGAFLTASADVLADAPSRLGSAGF